MGLFAQVAFHVRNHPRVRKLAREMGTSRLTALGALTSLWTLVGEQAEDGFIDAHRWSVSDLEEDLLWDGEHGRLVSALVQTEWLDVEPDGWSVPGWDSYTGAGLNKRSKNRAAVRKHREKRRLGAGSDDSCEIVEEPKCNITGNITAPDQKSPVKSAVTPELNGTERNGTELNGHASAEAPARNERSAPHKFTSLEDALAAEHAQSKKTYGEHFEQKYNPPLDGQGHRATVAGTIETAWDHVARPKAKNALRYLDNWLRDEARKVKHDYERDRRPANGSLFGGRNGQSGPPPTDVHGNRIDPPPGYVWDNADVAALGMGKHWRNGGWQ